VGPAAARDKQAMIRGLFSVAADLALPPRCPGCAAPVAADRRFCAACWSALRFIGPPWCVRCHLPFDHDAGPGATCDDCLTRPRRHGAVHAAVAYGPIARQLALRLKYGGRIGVADTMAALMMRQLPTAADLLVPVPLHRWRLWTRGYNQAVLIARAVARAHGTPVAVDALVRTRATPVLRGLSGGERGRAVRGAFAVPPSARARVAGRSVVLIDDIYTSGATADACAAALLDAGAAQVSVLCWARVLDGRD
jgi:ComF family protein